MAKTSSKSPSKTALSEIAPEVDIRRLMALEKYASEFSMLGGDYVFMRVRPGERLPQFESGPVRVKGMSIFLVRSGSLDVEVNLKSYSVKPGMLLVVSHETIFHVRNVDHSDLDIYCFIISPEFMRDINIDVAVLQTIRLNPAADPVLQLTETEEHLVSSYFEMLHTNTTLNTEPVYVRSISRCLMAAVVYQMMQIGRNRQPVDEPVTPGMARRSNYVRDFIRLVHEYHRRERSVAFYARKLFISSKYLSNLVKSASGRSAAEWIDDFVILEAKNLLRFSGKNIQQIAFDLNFHNQSAFGKYFKHLTGMSPTEFQHS